MNAITICRNIILSTTTRKIRSSVAIIMHQPNNRCVHNTSSSSLSPTHRPSLLERIRALDKVGELSQRYTPLVMFHPTNSDAPSLSYYVAIGHAETTFINSTLIHCKDEGGNPIFVKDTLPNNRLGAPLTEVLRLNMDIQTQLASSGEGGFNYKQLFQHRTQAFEQVTNHLIASGVISRKHDDLYPISPFDSNNESKSYGEKEVLAHINRNTAPYLGIDSVGVHLHCYACEEQHAKGDGTGSCDDDAYKEKAPMIKGVWLAKRAANKSHHANMWDPTVAGGQPYNLTILQNIAKEAGEEAGVPEAWVSTDASSNLPPDVIFSDHTNDPLTITTSKIDGSCMKRSIYYSCDLQVPHDWTPTPTDNEVSEFRLYSMKELEGEIRYGNDVRPAMRSVLLDFMIRHNALSGDIVKELSDAMRRNRLALW